MSILNNLKKKSKKDTGVVLKSGIVLLIESQKQFNKLAVLFEDIQEDSIVVDGAYVAYMDEYPALQVEPIENFSEEIDDFLEACSHKNLKPMDFDVWYRRLK